MRMAPSLGKIFLVLSGPVNELPRKNTWSFLGTMHSLYCKRRSQGPPPKLNMTEMGPRRALEEPMVPSLVSGAPTAQPLVSVPWTVPLPERQPPPKWLPSVAIGLLLATPSAVGPACP